MIFKSGAVLRLRTGLSPVLPGKDRAEVPAAHAAADESVRKDHCPKKELRA